MLPAVHERPAVFYPAFERRAPGARMTHYCPGCGHGLVAKYLAEAVEALGVQDRTILVSSVGCSVFSYYYLDVGNIQAAHGRAPAVATGVKRARHGALVVAIQGDGDLAAIGLAEIVHAANRGEPLTILFVNNAIYGMTGGQMAPTTLEGQVTSTTPTGRIAALDGHPLRMCELLETLVGPARIERVALGDARGCVAARRAVREALRWQVEMRGFSFLEILSPCPVGWKLEPVEARRRVREVMERQFPVRLFRAETRPAAPSRAPLNPVQVAEPAAPAGTQVQRNARRKEDQPARDLGLILAGSGGQGVLRAGLLLAEAGRRAGFEVSWLPSYGPEMRGGTAHCHVRLSRRPIGSPIVDQPDILLAMNAPSLARFGPRVRPGGLIVINTSLVEADPPLPGAANLLRVPATAEAEKAGLKRAGSMAALGAMVSCAGIVPRQALESALEEVFHDREMRLSALRALGIGWVLGAGEACPEARTA